MHVVYATAHGEPSEEMVMVASAGLASAVRSSATLVTRTPLAADASNKSNPARICGEFLWRKNEGGTSFVR